MKRRVLSDLFAIRHPSDFLREVLKICGFDQREPAGTVITNAYHVAFRLYRGELIGYLDCDTHYHDFAHAAETFLTMARLLHGAHLASEKFTQRELAVGLTAAILHDSGYIRTSSESKGSGARHRSGHEMRGMDFVSQHGEAIGLTQPEIAECQTMIQGTMMAEDVNTMSFESKTHELLTRMLSVSDLLAQLSSTTYLERLAFLYEEDRDANAPRYRDSLDCYRKAIQFDDRARVRLQNTLEQSDVYLANHFNARWNTSGTLYRVSMDRQIQFLTETIERKGFDPRGHLRRWGSVKALQHLLSGTVYPDPERSL
ncbi:MAG: hypothetical protein JJV98_03705 [Desulfosarcina sp.]|nr:hypothetical protein [Desulfobacterales bacterium]